MTALYATSFPGTQVSVRAARRFVTGVLRLTPGTAVPEEVVGTAELLVSECATNAVEHTRSGDDGQLFSLSVRVEPGRVHVEVKNRRPRLAHQVPHAREADPDAEHGRGLFLVRALSTRWGSLRLEYGVFFTQEWDAALPEAARRPVPSAPLPRRDATRSYWPRPITVPDPPDAA